MANPNKGREKVSVNNIYLLSIFQHDNIKDESIEKDFV